MKGHRYDCLLAIGGDSFIDGDKAALPELDAFLKNKDWVFGHLSYELKNAFFPASKSRPDRIGFPLFYFFEPIILLAIQGTELCIQASDPEAIFSAIHEQTLLEKKPFNSISINQSLSKKKYIEKITALQRHIQQGDCYEINFCQEFFSDEAVIDPLLVYQQLVKLSPTPYAAFYKINGSYLLCASPERFLQKEGNKLLAQPMKGTAKRVHGDSIGDETAAAKLKASPKEQAENVMIVDLMRNDLSKICQDGTVTVSELFGIHTFPQVHQMVSTIEGKLQDGICFSDILEATFPMGSMTGAPKKRVIELIDQYETSARGLFSGSVGYFHKGDFDINVVIRSIQYNEQTAYLSYSVGSGITIYSDPEGEWEECILKGEAIKKVLTQGSALC
ncbi:MAG: hypothetical protein JWP69_1098 [Flaviaesturariibacter sp.]|nr:hypothetical protein [Flaviaesturariibacter sp.]